MDIAIFGAGQKGQKAMSCLLGKVFLTMIRKSMDKKVVADSAPVLNGRPEEAVRVTRLIQEIYSCG